MWPVPWRPRKHMTSQDCGYLLEQILKETKMTSGNWTLRRSSGSRFHRMEKFHHHEHITQLLHVSMVQLLWAAFPPSKIIENALCYLIHCICQPVFLGSSTISAPVILRSMLFWDLRSVEWSFLPDVAGQPIGPILKGQAVQEGCLTLEDGTDGLSRNIIKKSLLLHRASWYKCSCSLTNALID